MPTPGAPSPEALEPATPSGEHDLAIALRAAQRGDEGAFIRVYREVHPGLLRYLRLLVGELAEDVGSEAWAQICRDLPRFDGDWSGFRGWATAIARNRAIDSLRAQRRRPSDPYPPEDLPPLLSAVSAAATVEESMSTEAVVAAIKSLPPDQAEAVYLRVILGMDSKAAGEVLGKRAGAVRTAAYRGLKNLATRLEPDRAKAHDDE